MKQPQTETEMECRGSWRTASSDWSFGQLDLSMQWQVLHIDRMIAAIAETGEVIEDEE